MLALLRCLTLLALGYGLYAVRGNADQNPQGGDLTNAFWLAYCVLIALFTAIAWAPWLGGRVADPLTGVLTDSPYVERPNRLLRLIRWLEGRRRRGLVRWLCFLEGVRHPWLPAPFITGLNHARPGSWLERAYAREVLRFNNVAHCLQATDALKRHGETPPLHANADVNLILMSRHKASRPEAAPLPVPPAGPMPLKRNPRIRLFESSPGEPPPAGDPPPPEG